MHAINPPADPPSFPTPYPHEALQPSQWQTVTAPRSRPTAPDPPDLTQRTIGGYEMLAIELSAPRSSVQPVYRRFEALNHRILLHLQDEITELEEHLRETDETIAQLDPARVAGQQQTPASRRAEARSCDELFHRRTFILGRSFQKMEQYYRVLRDFQTVTKYAHSADAAHVKAYQDWMAQHTPVHDSETRFLNCGDDLMLLNVAPTVPPQQPDQCPSMGYIPVLLMLPLLLYSLIPSIVDRLAATLLVAFVATALFAARGPPLPPRDCLIAGGIYMFLMMVLAVGIPRSSR
ncbi:hypothetical protein K470DRAFT_211724 [Piedraia hortae CBS 480.64]|uniref:DUF6594 domain-containing protein n=1 Tax=Piedraia hortae CBS 480.64 TaxID=1314780 RepID=A0A6A7C6M8_9PEZI|nr:hypothetical protein K470DRAFT_211724 [Piedraia hortae CBS 480.64]